MNGIEAATLYLGPSERAVMETEKQLGQTMMVTRFGLVRAHWPSTLLYAAFRPNVVFSAQVV